MEKITGKDLETLIQETVLRPLKMTHSSLVWQKDRAADAAAGHDERGRVKQERKLYHQPNAAYTLYCTVEDYAQFVLELMKPTLVSEALVQHIFEPAGPVIEEDIRFGLGWRVKPTSNGPRVSHGGSNGTGFRSYVEFTPETGSGIIILTNAVGGAALHRELVKAGH